MGGGGGTDAVAAAGSFSGPCVVHLHHVDDFRGDDLAFCRRDGWRREPSVPMAGGGYRHVLGGPRGSPSRLLQQQPLARAAWTDAGTCAPARNVRELCGGLPVGFIPRIADYLSMSTPATTTAPDTSDTARWRLLS